MLKKKNIIILSSVIILLFLIVGIIYLYISSHKYTTPFFLASDYFKKQHSLDYTTDSFTHQDDFTIVCLGNAPFSDDKDSEKNLCNLIASKTGTTVYNCSISNSYMSSKNTTFLDKYCFDAFSFYWLTTYFTVDNQSIYDIARENLNPFPSEATDTLNLLSSIDFNEVDIIAIMYDASDYLAERPLYNEENPTDIQTYSGALSAGIQLIHSTYPHIEIVVLSPAYAYTIIDDGSYLNSQTNKYDEFYLYDYVFSEFETSYYNVASFLDNFTNTKSLFNKSKYLEDYVHLSVLGRLKIANNFSHFLNDAKSPGK